MQLGPSFRETPLGIELIHAADNVFQNTTLAQVHKLQNYLGRVPFPEKKPQAVVELESTLSLVTTPNKRLRIPYVQDGELTQRGIETVQGAIREFLPHKTEWEIAGMLGEDTALYSKTGYTPLPVPDWPQPKVKPALKDDRRTFTLKPLPVVGKPSGFVEPPKMIAAQVAANPPTIKQISEVDRFPGRTRRAFKKAGRPPA